MFRRLLYSIFVFIIFILSIASPLLAKQGCCSWHDGVSHCDSSTGRYVCNDGTYSPTCTCPIDNYDYYGNYDGPSYDYETPSYDSGEILSESTSSSGASGTIYAIIIGGLILFGMFSGNKKG